MASDEERFVQVITKLLNELLGQFLRTPYHGGSFIELSASELHKKFGLFVYQHKNTVLKSNLDLIV